MKKLVYKTILIIVLLSIVFLPNTIDAGMADYTDQQADQQLKQEQEEWQQKQEDRINQSSNNYLKSLSIDGYNIIPEFDKQTIDYEISKEVLENNIKINAEADDSKASVSGIGDIILNSGENEIRIDVTAENGTVRTYTIKVVAQINETVDTNTSILTNAETSEYKEQTLTETKQDKTNYLYIIIAIIVVVIIISSMVFCFRKKNSKH